MLCINKRLYRPVRDPGDRSGERHQRRGRGDTV